MFIYLDVHIHSNNWYFVNVWHTATTLPATCARQRDANLILTQRSFSLQWKQGSMASRCWEHMTAEYSAPNRISEHLLEAQRGAGERREHRRWGNVREGRKGEGLQITVFRGWQSPWKHQLTAAVNGCQGPIGDWVCQLAATDSTGAHAPTSLCCTISYWWILEVREPVVFSWVAARFNPVVTQRSWFKSVGRKSEDKMWL